MRGLQIKSKLSQIFSPLLDLCSAVARRGIFISRARFFFSSLSSWHLPKVLILQSASARAGADRTFSDQYLGQVPRVKEDHLAREPEKAGIECISHGGFLGSMNLFLSTTF